MLSFLARRCVGIASVLVGIVIVTFIVVQLIPGDPARQLTGPEAPPEAIAQARRELGLDRPRVVQFGLYVARLARGDLGVSVATRRPVFDDLMERYPATIELTIASLIASAVIGIPLGIAAAVGRGQWLDHVSRLIALFGMSLPTFWLGLVLQWGLYGELGVLPVGSRVGWSQPGAALLHMILPTVTLSTVTLALLMRITRSAMLETLPQAFITTARSKGLSEWRVIGLHALRNAGPVIFTVIGLRLGTLFGGAVLTETVFSWPGVGLYAVQAVESKDFPAIMGFTLTLAFLYTLVNLFVDVSYGWLDPRMSQQEAA
jgi:peptide/nickel transport system permease protein